MNKQDFESPIRHFTETQEKFSREILEKARKALEKIEIDAPILSLKELEDNKNYLLLHRHLDANAFQIDLSVRGESLSKEEKISRLNKFDSLMRALKDSGINVYNQSPHAEPGGKTTGYTAWEFFGVTDEYRDEETTNQATILEICTMIAQKVGVELDLEADNGE